MIMHMLGGALAYAVAVSICYIPAIKAGPWYFPTGILCGIAANAIWLHLAKNQIDNSRILVAGFYWDTMIIITYTLIPVVLFGVRVSWTTAAGLVLIGLGIFLTKMQ